ncbi:cysteine methyltransferase [Elizabethkingia anophelis]|uniref:methylated-DNA--[protein]-cysteine S-methyltransferase n=1 Tax=Elizabethkingia anophelis TaxID=1117645 RepID=UPI000CE96E96|nr:methylated-DNA--[protein]-cysteine S-methyltransferase [Elizabethkingia anophelis]AVF49693.1 cysteine methyltransferase [Elizabethkingia anophelis]AVF50314.1 cysteine methyltransferase [Elizabethkingia anophelis]MBG0503780.1 methylated-DNA--[protein]-cysteine S-methyltransferase [Elizabethkingia anophelis]MCT4071232.1 methylated-DNA--[protein]-cysteine S-methyltransferase [Elizabethkingia anophelis]MDV3796580.1 cysteine methyltransferase [Elizabethkingia anophelis]
MKPQADINFQRVAEAIEYIQQHFKEQPSLEDIADNVHLSPYHFQRIFSDWAGTSPKKFLQYISLQYAKDLLKQNATLAEAAYETGLSGTGRLHDLFINIEGMTPFEYKNGGESLHINYSFFNSTFGSVFIASTTKGICAMTFYENKADAVQQLKKQFPNAILHEQSDAFQENALSIFSKDWQQINTIKLHLKGTDFQLKVWEALLKIPLGELTTYGYLAEQINNPKASRAVGTAIGSNPVAFLIPCHRVIQSTGKIGGYMWGPTRKTAIIGWEQARVNADL